MFGNVCRCLWCEGLLKLFLCFSNCFVLSLVQAFEDRLFLSLRDKFLPSVLGIIYRALLVKVQVSMPRRKYSALFCTCAVLLLAMLVRGYDGTQWFCIASIEFREALATDFSRFLALVLADHASDSLLELSHTWAAHIESRHTSQSGKHPLQALLSAQVQIDFLDIVSSWTRIVSDIISAQQMTSSQVIEMSIMLQGRIAINARSHANKYTVQNAAKCLANVLPPLLNVPAVTYDDELHDFISRRQSGNDLGDVSRLLNLVDAQAVVQIVKTLSVPYWMHLPQALELSDTQRINWSTLWVHVCEVRQALQKFHVAGLKRLVATPVQSYIHVLRATYSDLVCNASRGKCFCVLLITAVAAHLKLDIQKPVATKQLSVPCKDLRLLIIELARKGFSPKVALTGMPEYNSLVQGVALFVAHVPAQRIFSRIQVKKLKKSLPTTSILRRQCRALGIKVHVGSGVKRTSLSRAQMFRKLH